MSLLSNHDRERDVEFDWRSRRCVEKILRAAVQGIAPDTGAQTVPVKWHELANALCRWKFRVLDSVGEICSNMSSADDVVVMCPAHRKLL